MNLLKLKFGDKVRVNQYSLIYSDEDNKWIQNGTITGLVVRKRFKKRTSKNFEWYSAWNRQSNEIFDFVVGDHPAFKTKVKILKKFSVK